MRIPRKLPFLWRSLPYFLANLPVAMVQGLVLCIGGKDSHDRIRIVCIDGSVRQEFLSLVTKALEMISTTDRPRYHRVQDQIRRIIHLPTKDGAHHYRWLRACVIDPSGLKALTSDIELVPLLACVLVHESTHGFLLSRRMPFTRKISDRVELICCREMRRFADKANLGPTPWDTRR